MPSPRSSSAMPSVHMLMPYLAHRVGDVRREPARLHVERRREVEDVGVGGLLEMRNARLRAQEGARARSRPCMRSKRFTGVSSVPVRLMALALFTRMSMPPKACGRAARPPRAIATSSRTSSWRPAPGRRPPRSRPRRCGWCPGASGAARAVLAATATLAPSRAARSAIARPMPRVAPVMKRVLPASVVMDCPIACRRWPG